MSATRSPCWLPPGIGRKNSRAKHSQRTPPQKTNPASRPRENSWDRYTNRPLSRRQTAQQTQKLSVPGHRLRNRSLSPFLCPVHPDHPYAEVNYTQSEDSNTQTTPSKNFDIHNFEYRISTYYKSTTNTRDYLKYFNKSSQPIRCKPSLYTYIILILTLTL